MTSNGVAGAVVKNPDKPYTGFYQQAGIRYFQGISLTGRSLKVACPVTIITPTVRAVTISSTILWAASL